MKVYGDASQDEWDVLVDTDPLRLRDCARALVAERDRLVLVIQDMANELLQIEAHCPCGARPETPNTHPHVVDCPVHRALILWEANRA